MAFVVVKPDAGVRPEAGLALCRVQGRHRTGLSVFSIM
jgi:hypothetical protein